MYPNLTPYLLVLLAAALGGVTYVAVRRPFLRRLATRQIRRRPTEAVLVVAGSILGTTMIIASLVVGDTLNASVRDVAYRTLGPIDERIVSARTAQAAAVKAALAPLSRDPRVDGFMTVLMTPGAATRATGTGLVAEPRALVWEVDFATAATFGGRDSRDSGLSGPGPREGEVVLERSLARSLGARPGDEVALYPFGVEVRLRVARIVVPQGLAGMGSGAVNHDAFVGAGTLARARVASGRSLEPTTVTLVSNRGGILAGDELTSAVTAEIKRLAGAYTATGTTVETPKHDVLREAKRTGDVLGSVFLFISSFSIIAGVLLLVNIFVMLAEDRRAQLGMLRAIGMRRARVVGALTIEGTVFAGIASLLGIVTGLGVGRLVVAAAERIFAEYADSGNGGLSQMRFAVTRTTLVNGVSLGLLIGFGTVLLTSIRISNMNVIAAIRDLPTVATKKARRRNRWLAVAGVALFGALAVPAVAGSTGPGTYLFPPLTLLAAVPLLTTWLPKRLVHNGVAGLSLLWGLLCNTLRPHVFDNTTTTTYIVMGSLLAFSAVVLVGENQPTVLWPFRRLMRRPSEVGLSARLAVAYPTAKPFQTGATLAMYSLVMLTLVLMTQINGIMRAGIDQAVLDSSRGYAVRVDYSRVVPFTYPADEIRAAAPDQITEVLPLRSTYANGDDPGGRWTSPLPVTVVGVSARFAEEVYPLDERLPEFATDAAAWLAVATDEHYLVVDTFYGATGGPQGKPFDVGARITVTDPRTGVAVTRVVAGIMTSGLGFYGMDSGFTYPVFVNDASQVTQFGDAVAVSTALVRAAPDVSIPALAATLQGTFVRSALVADDIEGNVRENFAANESFFELMQGFLALGLVVGITGLGVVMVRAVRERRRTIGVLRALGFRARTIRRSFLIESGFVATEGILIGAGLSILTSWLLYENSAAFSGLHAPFPVEWLQIGVIVGVTFVVSMLATLAPASRAAKIKPAVAVRVSD